jgi:hypothetical protein
MYGGKGLPPVHARRSGEPDKYLRPVTPVLYRRRAAYAERARLLAGGGERRSRKAHHLLKKHQQYSRTLRIFRQNSMKSMCYAK